MRVVALAGGVGGAKLAHGFQQVLAPGELTVVVNTGDDVQRHGLLVCPDHDTVLYTLAGVANRQLGWGIEDETWTVMTQLGRLGEETWFRLGDRDLATHLFRSTRIAAGARLTEVSADLRRALGVPSAILPMADEPIRTHVNTDEGWLPFQEYFVRLRQEPTVREVRFEGVAAARPTPEIEAALAAAELVVVCPSNPIVSIGPILAVPGMRDAIAARRARGVPVVAVSGIIAGHALKGPADKMLAGLGEEVSAVGVARRYRGLADTFVLDSLDVALVAAIRELGLEAVVTDTIMNDDDARARLASAILDLA